MTSSGPVTGDGFTLDGPTHISMSACYFDPPHDGAKSVLRIGSGKNLLFDACMFVGADSPMDGCVVIADNLGLASA